MANKQALKRRIKSANSINKITSALEAVSGSKMIKAQDRAGRGRNYKEKLELMIKMLHKSVRDVPHPLLKAPNPEARPLTIIISSNKGLAGAFNTNLFRKLEKELDPTSVVLPIGKKISIYAPKTSWNIVASFNELPDFLDYSDIKTASDIALEEYLKGRVSSVSVAYQKFVNTLKSEPTIERVLPLSIEEEQIALTNSEAKQVTIFEPSADALLEELLTYSISVILYQAALSSKASEQSARMVAMKNASSNAQDLGEGLRRRYNKEYQKQVTSEISDVVTARMAITK